MSLVDANEIVERLGTLMEIDQLILDADHACDLIVPNDIPLTIQYYDTDNGSITFMFTMKTQSPPTIKTYQAMLEANAMVGQGSGLFFAVNEFTNAPILAIVFPLLLLKNADQENLKKILALIFQFSLQIQTEFNQDEPNFIELFRATVQTVQNTIPVAI